ncbi:TIGR00341 family protein [Pontibacter beigongshangensis]|uniref:TIGR00341 family protein n=1 Tax=Pontibacter beigongshangensis TaxID=2574733 RepID=UPI0016501BBB|nr:TIGR00341 family protein [Pontibacter beigongshangensis]
MLLRALKNTLDGIFNIQNETDEEGTIREIYDKTPIRGNNTWMLICSAMLASIGLDVGSGAVIIGAMLISPLMSPILGVGLSVGINDKEMLIASMKNLTVAALAGLMVSTFYFWLTPLGEPTNEILARTQPTLLDVMVAFFGGVAGIVSISRSDKSNAIPGVAIATALMPPLCTAGYGLAMGRLNYFFGGFYLFFINAVFISLATFLIVKYLKFEVKHYLDKKKERQVARVMGVILFIVVLPSVYFLYNIYKEVQTKKKIENLIVKDFAGRNNEILKWEIADSDSISLVKIYSVGSTLEEGLVNQYNTVLKKNDLSDYQVKVVQLDVSAEDVQQMASQITNNLTRDFLKTVEIQKLQNQRLDSLRKLEAQRYTSGQATTDLRLLFPEIRKAQIGEMVVASESQRQDTVVVVMLEWQGQALPVKPGQPGKPAQQKPSKIEADKVREHERRIGTFVARKLKRDSVQVVSSFSGAGVSR